MRRVSLLAVLLMVTAAGACGPECGCLVPATAVIKGQVSNSVPQGLAQATVLGYVLAAATPCVMDTGPSGASQTDAGGHYRMTVAQGASLDSACVFVEFRAPQGSGLRDTVIGPLRLSLRYAAPFDSTTLDVTLVP